VPDDERMPVLEDWQAVLLAALIAGAITLVAAAWNRGWEVRLALADRRTELYLSMLHRLEAARDVDTRQRALTKRLQATGQDSSETAAHSVEGMKQRVDVLGEKTESLRRRIELAASTSLGPVLAQELAELDAALKETRKNLATQPRGKRDLDSISMEIDAVRDLIRTMEGAPSEINRAAYLASSLAVKSLERCYWAKSKLDPDASDDEWDAALALVKKVETEFLSLTSWEVRALRRSIFVRYYWMWTALAFHLRLRRNQRAEGW
jgi:hypothetical protein